MRVTYASFDEVPSFKGASTHILCGLREVRKLHDVTLLSLGTQALRPSWGIAHRPFAITERNIFRRGLIFRERVAGWLRRHRPQLMHFRSPWEGLAAVRAGAPSVYEVNGLPSVELPYYYRNISERVLALLQSWERECLEACSQIICPSPKIQNYLITQRNVPSEKIALFPNAHDPVPRLSCESRDSSDPLRLVYLGTLSPWQGILWTLKIFSEFHGRVTLDIYSQPGKTASRRFERRLRRYGIEESVRMLPPAHRITLREILPQYDFGFAPFLKTVRNTEQGCCPLKLLDYLSHGLPVLGADLAIVREYVNHGANGLLFHPNSFDSLRQTLSSILESPESKAALRRTAAGKGAGGWTWAEYGDALARLYNQL